MGPRQRLQQAHAHVRARVTDRARALTFARFVWRRFLDDRLFEAAGALSFTTVFALVPLSMVVFGVLSGFKAFQTMEATLTDYIFRNFVPSSAEAVAGYLKSVAANASELTTAGVIALVVSLLITLTGVETTFNRIWRVPTARPKFSRFLVYWTVITLGALMAAASLALSVRFFALSIFETEPGRLLEGVLLRVTPMLIELLAFACILKVVPHRTVRWPHAFAGALLAMVLFELIRWGIGLYLGSFNAYQKLYGPLAFVPIFLIWIYLGWCAILFGASLASSIAAFRYQPAALRLPQGYEIYAMLRMLGRFAQARERGRGLHSDEIRQLEPIMTDSLVQQLVGALAAEDILVRAEDGSWLLARDLEDVSLAEVYMAAQLRVPIHEAVLPCREDPLGVASLAALDRLRLPLRDALKLKVASVYAELDRESGA